MLTRYLDDPAATPEGTAGMWWHTGDPDDIRPLLDRLAGIGLTDWILADSCCYAAPPHVTGMIRSVAPLAGGPEHLAVQIHDSRGMGLAVAAESARLGVGTLDCAPAGSGGHPADPGARVGGACTEDAVHLLHLTGTRIDLAALIDAATWLDGVLGVAGPGTSGTRAPYPTAAPAPHRVPPSPGLTGSGNRRRRAALPLRVTGGQGREYSWTSGRVRRPYGDTLPGVRGAGGPARSPEKDPA